MIYELYKGFITVLLYPFFLWRYFSPETGAEYDIDLWTKLFLVGKMLLNTHRIETETSFLENLVMVTAILRMPASVEGCIVECGTYRGGCTANLTLAASVTGRYVHGFDSFSGLPDSSQSEIVSPLGIRHRNFTEGEFESSIDVTKSNVERYGAGGNCTLHPGLFGETLPEFDEQIAFVFTDVDLRGSLETCLLELWPSVQEGGYWFTHEVHHRDISTLFFQHSLWEDELNEKPPTLIGAGNGLGLHPEDGVFVSQIGYTVKQECETTESG